MTNTIHLREIDPGSKAEIDLVAQRMLATIVEVEGNENAAKLHSLDWLRERLRWHLDPAAVSAKVWLAVNAGGEIIGHSIVRIVRRLGDTDYGTESGGPFGLVSTTYVIPEARRLGVADLLLNTDEAWFRSQGLPSASTWTAANNEKLIRLYAKHGYVQVEAQPNVETGSMMVRLQKCYAVPHEPVV